MIPYVRIQLVLGTFVVWIIRGVPCQHGFMCGCKQWSNDINIIQIDLPDGNTKLFPKRKPTESAESQNDVNKQNDDLRLGPVPIR